MVLAVEADDHGSKLIVSEDKVALTVMAINEHTHRLERNVEGHRLRLPDQGEGLLANGQTPRDKNSIYTLLEPRADQIGWAWPFHNWSIGHSGLQFRPDELPSGADARVSSSRVTRAIFAPMPGRRSS
jgi:hypothetical protein